MVAGLLYMWPNLCSSLSESLSAPHAFTILCILEGKMPFLIAILFDGDSNKE